MHPVITLGEERVRANLLAWSRYCRVPIWPVLKAQGYGWGAARLARLLEPLAAGYYVADLEEFLALRPHTQHAIGLLGEVQLSEIAPVLDAGGIPTLASLEALEAASHWAQQRGRRASVRIGLSAAVGWSGISLGDAPAFAAALQDRPLNATLSTHITSPGLASSQAAALREFAAVFRKAGVRLTGLDWASTASARPQQAENAGDHARIGAGLFGAKGAPGEGDPKLTCAISVVAPVVARSISRAGRPIGYGNLEVEGGQHLLTVRCGYADGFPRGLARSEKILAVGMQYTTLLADNAHSDSSIALIDERTDLDALALRANCLPHEIVVALGVHSTARERSHG